MSYQLLSVVYLLVSPCLYPAIITIWAVKLWSELKSFVPSFLALIKGNFIVFLPVGGYFITGMSFCDKQHCGHMNLTLIHKLSSAYLALWVNMQICNMLKWKKNWVVVVKAGEMVIKVNQILTPAARIIKVRFYFKIRINLCLINWQGCIHLCILLKST